MAPYRNHTNFIVTLLVVVLLAGIAVAAYYIKQKNYPSSAPVACTMEALQCPDGSYVSRVGPDCHFAACPDVLGEATTTPTQIPQTSTTTASIHVGYTAIVNNVAITFNSVVEDNRCPVDVQCIVAGAVTTSITVSAATTTSAISSVTRNIASNEAPFLFNGYKISIDHVNPPRISKITPDPLGYVVTFKVIK